MGNGSLWMQWRRVVCLQSVCAMESAGIGLKGVALQGFAGSSMSVPFVVTSHIMRLCVLDSIEGSRCCLWRCLSQGQRSAATQAMRADDLQLRREQLRPPPLLSDSERRQVGDACCNYTNCFRLKDGGGVWSDADWMRLRGADLLQAFCVVLGWSEFSSGSLSRAWTM